MPMIFNMGTLGLLGSNLSEKVANDFLKVYAFLLASNLSQKVANDFLKMYTWFACVQLESEGCQ